MELKENAIIGGNIEDNEKQKELQAELIELDREKEEKLKLIREGDHSEVTKKEVRELVEKQIDVMKRISVIEMIYNLDAFEKHITLDFINRPKEATLTFLVIFLFTLIVGFIIRFFFHQFY